MSRCRTAEAAAITGLPKRTLQDKAAAGLIPGARKVFGRWTFDVDALQELGSAPSPKAHAFAGATGGAVARLRPSDIERRWAELFGPKKRRGAGR